MSLSWPVVCARICAVCSASAVPTAGIVTGTDLVWTFAVMTGTGPPAPRRPPPPPLPDRPAPDAAPPPVPWAATAGAAALSDPFSHEQEAKETHSATKTAAFFKWLGILADKEMAVYVNDCGGEIVYRKG